MSDKHTNRAKNCYEKVRTDPLADSSIGLSYARIDKKHLAPSFTSTVLSSLSALLSPVGAVLTIIVGISALGLSAEMVFEKLNKDAQARPLAVAEPIVKAEILNEPLIEEPTALHAQLNFISGIIAIRRPAHAAGGKIAKAIVEVSEELDVNPLYIAAVVSAESGFSPTARSHKNAIGLMQLLPTTAKEVYERTEGKKSYPRLKDPHTNIRLGITYLKQLERKYRGNRHLALAAYNWGPRNVDLHRMGKRSMPKSVKRYADTIISSSTRWSKHFEIAEDSSAKL